MGTSSQIIRFGGRLFSGLKRLGLFRDPISQWIFERLYTQYKLLIEARPIVRTMKLIVAGSTVIDVGANIGILTVPFAHHVGPKGVVLAIEPAPANIVSLRNRVAAANLSDRVQTFAGVASNKVGRESLVLKPLEPWDHHIGPNGISVEATTLDALVNDIQPPRVSYVKIDVQGAELLVLEGMQRILRESRPAICVEIHPQSLHNLDTSPERLIEFLGVLDYRMHRISRSGFSPMTEDELRDILSFHDYTDVVFLHSATEYPS